MVELPGFLEDLDHLLPLQGIWNLGLLPRPHQSLLDPFEKEGGVAGRSPWFGFDIDIDRAGVCHQGDSHLVGELTSTDPGGNPGTVSHRDPATQGQVSAVGLVVPGRDDLSSLDNFDLVDRNPGLD